MMCTDVEGRCVHICKNVVYIFTQGRFSRTQAFVLIINSNDVAWTIINNYGKWIRIDGMTCLLSNT